MSKSTAVLSVFEEHSAIAERLADLERVPNWQRTFPSGDVALEIGHNDGAYAGGRVRLLRVVAPLGDEEAGSALIGFTGNEVEVYRVDFSCLTPTSVLTAAFLEAIGSLGGSR